MVKAFELNKDDVNDEIPAPMAEFVSKNEWFTTVKGWLQNEIS